MCLGQTDASSEVHEMVRGLYGAEDFKLFVADYITSVDNTIDEMRASLPEQEQNGAAMREFEDVCRGKLLRRLDLVSYLRPEFRVCPGAT